MDLQAYQHTLRRAFDNRIEVKRDLRDGCMVVWDRTRSGHPYPAYKVACNTDVPSQIGVPRDAYERDITWLRRNNWAEKYGGGRPGLGKQLINDFYRTPYERRKEKAFDELHEKAEHSTKDFVERRCGIKNTISLAPIGENGGAGGMKNRHQGQRKINKARQEAMDG